MPNRSEDLSPSGARNRRHRSTEVVTGISKPASIPDPNPDWCQSAKMMWDAMLESGGAGFYESSDYAALYLICDQIDHLYGQGRRSPEYLRVIMQGLASLLATEGDRRRLHVELEKQEDDNASVMASVRSLFPNSE